MEGGLNDAGYIAAWRYVADMPGAATLVACVSFGLLVYLVTSTVTNFVGATLQGLVTDIGLSADVAGVTLLSWHNALPDVLLVVVAVSQGAPATGLVLVLSSCLLTTTVTVATANLAAETHQTVDPIRFSRDVGFYLAALLYVASLVLYGADTTEPTLCVVLVVLGLSYLVSLCLTEILRWRKPHVPHWTPRTRARRRKASYLAKTLRPTGYIIDSSPESDWEENDLLLPSPPAAPKSSPLFLVESSSSAAGASPLSGLVALVSPRGVAPSLEKPSASAGSLRLAMRTSAQIGPNVRRWVVPFEPSVVSPPSAASYGACYDNARPKSKSFDTRLHHLYRGWYNYVWWPIAGLCTFARRLLIPIVAPDAWHRGTNVLAMWSATSLIAYAMWPSPYALLLSLFFAAFAAVTSTPYRGPTRVARLVQLVVALPISVVVAYVLQEALLTVVPTAMLGRDTSVSWLLGQVIVGANALSGLFATVAVAHRGQPSMALGSCFGGPTLSLLASAGYVQYQSWKLGAPVVFEAPSLVTQLLVVLCLLAVVVNWVTVATYHFAYTNGLCHFLLVLYGAYGGIGLCIMLQYDPFQGHPTAS